MSWKGPLDEAISYDWHEIQQKGGRMPAVRTGATSCLHKGNIYLFFGFGAGVGRSSDVWRFNIQQGLWNIVETKGNNSDKPNKRDGHSTTNVGDGKLIIFGGQGDPSPNEKSERVLDVVKTKTWEVRDLYNDLFSYDCNTNTFEMLCPEGGVPLCRRGHSAIYFPKGGYNETQLNIPHLTHHHGHHGHTHNHHDKSSSPKKSKNKKGLTDEIIDVYDPIPENSVIVFGGSGMEVSKYIEAVYNDIWVYNLDSGRWNKTKCRGIEPKPLFEHRSVRVGHMMLVIGGITATNAKSTTIGNELSENHEVMILNLKTLVWSYVDIVTSTGKHSKLNLHGHSLVCDPHEPGIVYLFGGKDTVDGKQSSMETINGAKKWLKRGNDCHSWVIDVTAGTMSPMSTKTSAPINRYEHLTQSGHANEGTLGHMERQPPPKRKAGIREEPLMYIFGGAHSEIQGICQPTMYALTRTFTYTNPELISIGAGSKAPSQVQGNQGGSIGGGDNQDDNNTISTVHTADASSIYTAQQGAGTDNFDEDDLKQPSIWEKRQKMEEASGKRTQFRTPSSWNDLKLALSCSLTEKRSSHLQASPGSPEHTPSVSRPESPNKTTSNNTANTLSQSKTDNSSLSASSSSSSSSSSGLTLKQQKKQEIAKLKSLGATVLPIVKGKAYKDAKDAYFKKFPAPVPAIRTYDQVMSMTKSQSQSQLGLAGSMSMSMAKI
jgi:hypothetical protein